MVDTGDMALLIGSVGSAAGGIISAVALLRRAAAPTARAVAVLRRLADWLAIVGQWERLPPRLRRDIAAVLDHPERHRDDDDDEEVSA